MSDDYYRRQFFVTDEDQDLWNRYQSRSRHRYIPLLKIALLREWQAELATSRNANEKSRNIEDLHEYRELKTQMKEASCCLRIHKKIVREELKEARGGCK
ncbi:hypothetical protein RRF57_001412 [Xylaria bambusicola]|uniref:Uncharacterized protein n=1 Tax=Xylaria bambusicola TaxID=326684 RepID=A0AAN7UH84_9PEZI